MILQNSANFRTILQNFAAFYGLLQIVTEISVKQIVFRRQFHENLPELAHRPVYGVALIASQGRQGTSFVSFSLAFRWEPIGGAPRRARCRKKKKIAGISRNPR